MFGFFQVQTNPSVEYNGVPRKDEFLSFYDPRVLHKTKILLKVEEDKEIQRMRYNTEEKYSQFDVKMDLI